MKDLFLVRHAKSSWKFPELSDFERPLNKRGKRDAPFIGEMLAKSIEKPDLIVTSPAKRAFSTAKIFAKELNYSIANIKKDIKIYLAEEVELLKIIKKISDKNDRVMLVGHNPGLSDLYNMLSDESIEELPTCAVVHLRFSVDSWQKIARKSGKMMFFEFPKKYFIQEEK